MSAWPTQPRCAMLVRPQSRVNLIGESHTLNTLKPRYGLKAGPKPNPHPTKNRNARGYERCQGHKSRFRRGGAGASEQPSKKTLRPAGTRARAPPPPSRCRQQVARPIQLGRHRSLAHSRRAGSEPDASEFQAQALHRQWSSQSASKPGSRRTGNEPDRDSKAQVKAAELSVGRRQAHEEPPPPPDRVELSRQQTGSRRAASARPSRAQSAGGQAHEEPPPPDSVGRRQAHEEPPPPDRVEQPAGDRLTKSRLRQTEPAGDRLTKSRLRQTQSRSVGRRQAHEEPSPPSRSTGSRRAGNGTPNPCTRVMRGTRLSGGWGNRELGYPLKPIIKPLKHSGSGRRAPRRRRSRRRL